MERLLKPLVRYYLLIAIVSVFVVFIHSCSGRDEEYATHTIEVDNIKTNDSISGFWTGTINAANTIYVAADASFSNIKDVAFDSTECFVLDSSNSVAKVSLRDGTVLKRVNRTGRAAYEYISPQCLALDSLHLYVYDSGKQRILCYSRELCYMGDISVDCAIMSFVASESGFHIVCLDDMRQWFVSVSRDGKATYKRQLSDVVLTGSLDRPFVKYGPYGKIYTNAAFSDTVFVWNQDRLIPEYTFDFKENRPPKSMLDGIQILESPYCYLRDFFVSKSGLIGSCVYKSHIVHLRYDIRSGSLSSGNVSMPKGQCFMPKWQNGNLALCVWQPEQYAMFAGEIKDDSKLIIQSYELK